MASSHSEDLSRKAARNDAVEFLARLGYAVKGVIYGLVGVLAVMAAVGEGGKTTGSRGAIETIEGGTFGQVLLWIIGVGLVGYTLWRFAQAALDVDRKGDDAEGILKRIGLAGSGVVYGLLAYSVFRTLLGNGGGGGGGSTADTWTARLMEQPAGPWLVGAAALIAVGVGVYQFWRAYDASFLDHWRTAPMSHTERVWGTRVARFGIAARGVVFVLIGYFLFRAALEADPTQARGLGGVLDAMGPVVLGVVAAGFVAYGVYCFLNARYREIGAG